MVIEDFKILERLTKPYRIYNLYYFRPIKGFSIDSRSIKRQEGFIAIRGKYHNGHKFIQKAVDKGASFIVAQEYIPTKPKVPFFVVSDTYSSLKSIAAYIRKRKKPLVYGITGSIGKTTTKEILSFLLESRFRVLKNKRTENNLLGVAKTILSLKGEEIMILELGTSAKGEMETLGRISRPDIGIITFIKPVHLEGLRDLEGVFKEKTSLFNINSKMKVVLNRDDCYLAKVGNRHKIYWFGKDRGNNLFVRLVKRENSNSVFCIQDKYKLTLPTHLEGFIANFLAAILGAHIAGIPLSKLVSKAGNFKDFPPMRMQMQRLGRFYILNDAYNANPYSFQQALKVLKNYSLRKIAVIGDMLELDKKSIYYHELLASQIIKSNFDYCLTLGKYTAYLANRLRKLGYRQVFHFSAHKPIAEFIKRKIGSRNINKRYLIFLKGSRKMELEKVISYLK